MVASKGICGAAVRAADHWRVGKFPDITAFNAKMIEEFKEGIHTAQAAAVAHA
jgi:hypothetical protein